MLLKLRVTSGSNAGKEIIINKDKFLIGLAVEFQLDSPAEGARLLQQRQPVSCELGGLLERH